jgi:ribosome-associated heat shock protein Hsp15
MDNTRVDKWLWAVRAYPTRTAATDGCQGGHVRVNDTPAKPATPVKVGDRVAVTGQGRERSYEVVRVIDKRVGAAIAAECIVDHSPPPPRPCGTVPRARPRHRPTHQEGPARDRSLSTPLMLRRRRWS